MINENIKIHLAGILDRGCSLSIRADNSKKTNKTYHSLQIILSSKLEIVKYIQKLYGGSISQKPNSKTSYRITLTNKQARILIKDVAPYILFKQKEIDVCLRFIDLPRAMGREGIPDEVRKERDKLRIELCELNLQKGYGKYHYPTSEILKL